MKVIFSLIEKARNENDICVVSIFVNPTQFNNSKDFDNYPSTLEGDIEKLKSLKCDFVFVPDKDEMYLSKPILNFDFGKLENSMEGANRPGHFNGVGLVVSKLFNIISPSRAYFGQKDFQQFAIISQLVKDLSFNVELVCCPTLREDDGLAMSSRNLRLTKEQRIIAPIVYATLLKTKELLRTETVERSINLAKKEMSLNDDFRMEYLEVVDYSTLEPLTVMNESKIAICIASFLGEIRLIDNIIL